MWFNDLVCDIDCDARPGGHLFITHKAARTSHRLMPILSNGVVTRPLTDAEIGEARFRPAFCSPTAVSSGNIIAFCPTIA